IHISFSFSATITADATIQVSDHDPPWYSHELPRRTRGPAAQLAMPLRAPMPRPLAADHDVDRPNLSLHPAPQFTVASPDGRSLASQQGAFVFLLVTDAPVADGEGNRAGSSFESLCRLLLPWVIDALKEHDGTEADIDGALETVVSKDYLETCVKALKARPISAEQIEQKFLQPGL